MLSGHFRGWFESDDEFKARPEKLGSSFMGKRNDPNGENVGDFCEMPRMTGESPLSTNNPQGLHEIQGSHVPNFIEEVRAGMAVSGAIEPEGGLFHNFFNGIKFAVGYDELRNEEVHERESAIHWNTFDNLGKGWSNS